MGLVSWQVLSLKLGVAGKRDLAQQCRASFSPRFSSFLWVTAEIAICATDLAEVGGCVCPSLPVPLSFPARPHVK